MLEVEEYVEQRIKELVAFRDHWKKNHAETPLSYPKSLNESEWYDQEVAFNSVENGRFYDF